MRFGSLDEAALDKWFDRAQLDVNARQWEWIEQYCAGSPGMALLAAEYGFHGWWETLQPMTADLVRGRFPATMGETMATLVDEFAQLWVKNHENASKDAANKDGLRQLLSLLAAYARRSLQEQCDGSDPSDYWVEVIDLIRQAELLSEANVNLKQLLENIAVQWLHLAREGAGV